MQIEKLHPGARAKQNPAFTDERVEEGGRNK